MVLHIYVDFLSQPSRAVVTFAGANNIPHEVKVLSIRDLEHKQASYLGINPMGKVPAIDDDGFSLFESHAILRYLATSRSTPDHWYPADPTKRAAVDCILDWHHTNLREGARNVVFHRVLGRSRGLTFDEQSTKEKEEILEASLKFIEDNWLTGDGPFLRGASQPSLADLSLACEVKQLEMLDRSLQERFLGPRIKIKNWVQATEDGLAPHFAEAHSLLSKVSQKIQAKRDAEGRRSAL